MKNLNIKSNFIILAIGVIISFAIFGIVGGMTLRYTSMSYYNSITSTELMMEYNVNILDTAGELRSITAITLNRDQVSDADKTNLSAVKNELSTLMNNTLDYTSNLQPSETLTSIMNDMKETIALVDSYESLVFQYIDAINTGSINTSVAQQLNSTGDDLFTRIPTITLKAFSLINLETDKIRESVISIAYVLIGMFILCSCFTLIIVRRTYGQISKPTKKLQEASVQIANGNMNVDIRMSEDNEIGKLSNAMADMADSISDILNDIHTLADKLEQGDLVNYKIPENKYNGAFAGVVKSINKSVESLVNDTNDIIDSISGLANGDFRVRVKDLPGDKQKSTEALRFLRWTLQEFVLEIINIIEDIKKGDLRRPIDMEGFYGEWLIIGNGLVELLERVDAPMQDIKEVLSAFSQGDFSKRIDANYQGAFGDIKQSANYMGETIGAYISEISDVLMNMANQNFDVETKQNYVGDFTHIEESLVLIVQNLNELTRNIIQSAEQVSDGAKQISNSSFTLAEGATDQSRAVELLNATVNIMSEQVEENAESSNQANILSNETRVNANTGNDRMSSMLIAMEEINEASSSISNIIKVIDDIAFQTNILALNAAVEAARAGEHGKGFAVVAEEVRSLANRSQEAAKQTTNLIQTSVDKVADGSRIANETSQALISILEQIEEITSLVDKSALLSKEQKVSIQQVTNGIGQISRVTQSNTATSEESAAASEELATQAEIFYNSVIDIKLKK